MSYNFLTEYKPDVDEGYLVCQLRGQILAKPEELVRQRVLHWLIHEAGWHRDFLRVEEVSSAGRTDIELLDDDRKAQVVVECKHAKRPLGHDVDQQAIKYANKNGAKWIWTTNGASHGFLMKSGSEWKRPPAGTALAVISSPPEKPIRFPANVDDVDEVEQFLGLFDDGANYKEILAEKRYHEEQRFILSVYRVLFDVGKAFPMLPYSQGGVHIHEDRGPVLHFFGNRGGGGYSNRYADYIVSTRGTKKELVSVMVNRQWTYYDEYKGPRICVGVTKPNGEEHHALQLDSARCEWNPDTKSWSIYHRRKVQGKGTKVVEVMKAVRGAGAGSWIVKKIKDKSGKPKEWVCLGELPDAASPNWEKARELLANLIHYGIIRSNLRDAVAKRNRR